MTTILRILFGAILLVMLSVTSYASLKCNIMQIPPEVTGHPWFQATLFDAYCGFLTFYVWVYYKEASTTARVFWFILIMLLGNLAMSAYMLILLLKIKKDAPADRILLRD